MLVKSKELKEEGNTLFKSKTYKCAIRLINMDDKALDYPCLAIPEN